MRDLSVTPNALETAVTAVKGRKRVTDQVRRTQRMTLLGELTPALLNRMRRASMRCWPSTRAI